MLVSGADVKTRLSLSQVIHGVVIFKRIEADNDPITAIFGIDFKILPIKLHIGKCAVDGALSTLAKGLID